eukprot:GFUD01102553.1.p1 GENE.GFUD01102553.1~~GFUD01102553.1.p1  ORF type:complete len:302 (-),score=42.45 GFUD01102553.1:82-858(-)
MQPINADSPCSPSPCGPGARCQVQGNNVICSCPRGYSGNGLVFCRRGECFSDSECPNYLACFDYKCKDPCKGPDTACGANAQCKVINHGVVCSCPAGYQGNPVVQCYRGRSSYEYKISEEPRRVGTFLSSSNRGLGLLGEKRSSTSGFLCSPNPCGQGADCNVGSDRSGQARPVCTCSRGYSGNALTVCRRGECFSDSECSDYEACFDYNCMDPCRRPDPPCGENAECQVVRKHGAVCSCPSGYQGDPLTRCSRGSSG